MVLTSGKQTKSELENGPVEIEDFPIKNGGSFHSYVNVWVIATRIGITSSFP
jgi:hypothetical protein